MGHYAVPQDVLVRIDQDMGPVRVDRLNTCITEAEQLVDGKLALRCTLPISESTHPEWFTAAKHATIRLAAADYTLDQLQAIGDETRLTRAREMRRDALEWLKELWTPLVPDNVPAPVSAYINSPDDGGGAARTSTAQFQTSMVTLGNSNHW